MIIEDYYGIASHRQNATEFGRDRSFQRSERSPIKGSQEMRSPKIRTLKRTELSNQKLHSKDKKNEKVARSPSRRVAYPSQTMQYEQAVSGNYAIPNDQSSRNKQQFEIMAKKYDGYMRADSVEFTNGEINRSHRSINPIQGGLRPQSRPRQNQYDRRYDRYMPQEEEHENYHRNYHSASKDKNTELLMHFQRQKVTGNAIDRANNNKSSRSNQSRYKKSKSLTNKLKKQYIMHTFYHADKRNLLDYNEDGYRTQRQQELLLVIEDKARRAFDRATYENESVRRPSEKRPSRPKKFNIQENSRLQHKNSDILSDLRQDHSKNLDILSGSPARKISQKSQRIQTKEKVIDVSIDPRKEEYHYDDYQMKQAKKSVHEINSNPSISQYMDQSVAPKKDVFTNFAKEDDDSLLQFRPSKPKQQQKQPEKELNKKSSEISQYKSIDMVQINSNCKLNDREELKQKDKIQYINQDQNRSLGINTIRNFEMNKKKSVSSHKESHLSVSSSESLSNSQSLSQNQSHSQSSHKLSKSGSNIEKYQQNQQKPTNFKKNKLKISQSLSQTPSDSLKNELSKPLQHISPLKIESNVAIHKYLTDSDQLSSSRGLSIAGVQTEKKIKVKKIKKADHMSESQSKSKSSESSNKIQGLQVLGFQSFPKIDRVDSFQIKVNPMNASSQRQMSRIDEIIQRSNSQQNSKLNNIQSGTKSKPLNSVSSSLHNRSQNSINNRSFNSVVNNSVADRSKVRQQRQVASLSSVQYDIFNQIRQFIEQEQYEYHQPRKQRQVPQLITEELGELLNKIEEHLYLLNCIAELIIIIPDVYEFETIYAQEKEWIFLSIFLTLKKYLHERYRVATALSGGKNCFLLLGWTIDDSLLKKYLQRPQVKSIMENLVQCNGKLDGIMTSFYNFMIKFKKLQNSQPFINLRQFNNSDELPVLLGEYDKEIDNLLKKRGQEFNNGNVPQADEQQFQMLSIVNQRIFRMMEVAFVLSNLAGKEVKSYEKDEQLFREEQKFKDYILQNHQLFKHMIRSFK